MDTVCTPWNAIHCTRGGNRYSVMAKIRTASAAATNANPIYTKALCMGFLCGKEKRLVGC